VARIDDLTVRDLAQVVWACAKAGHHDAALFADVERAALPRLHQANSQDVANLVWAFTTNGVEAPRLYGAVADFAEPRLRAFSPQAIANVAWAYARASSPDTDRVLAAIVRALPPRLPELCSCQLGMLVWALAKGGAHHAPAFAAIADEIRGRNLEVFSDVELVISVWAFSAARARAPLLLEAVEPELVGRMSRLGVQSLRNVAWAYARSHMHAPALFDAIARELPRRPAQDFAPQHYASVAWAFATIGAPARAVVEDLGPHMAPRAGEFRAVEVANVLWSLAVVLCPSEELWRAFVARAEAIAPEIEAAGAEALCQLHQANLALQLDLPGLGVELPPALARKAQEAMAEATPQPHLSARHRSVSAALHDTGVVHDNEARIPELGYVVDMRLRGTNVVVEVNGPCHYDSAGRRLPATAMKVRHLRAAGWDVVEVPHWEWPEGQAQQQAYLERKIDACRPGGLEGGVVCLGTDLEGGRARPAPARATATI